MAPSASTRTETANEFIVPLFLVLDVRRGTIFEHRKQMLHQLSIAEALSEDIRDVLAFALVAGLLVQVRQTDLSLSIVLLEGILVGLSVKVVQEGFIVRPGTESDHVGIEEALRFRTTGEASSSQLATSIIRQLQHVVQVIVQLHILSVVAWDVLRTAGKRTVVLVVALEGTVGLHAWLSVAFLGQMD
uniref:Uncharacterized protein n=1 Tax=Anopheles culicifacies TaxID=139723 RepID=A0A182ME74_9DIPT